jgi:NDP-sugar pyrophosphorylase family protein
MADDGFCDFGFDVFPRLIEENLPVYGYLLNQDEYLMDVGTIDRYRQANEDMNAGKVKIPDEE